MTGQTIGNGNQNSKKHEREHSKGARVVFGAGSDVGFSALDPLDPLRPAESPVFVNRGNGEQPEFFWQKDDEEMDLDWRLLEEVVETDTKRDLVMSQWAALDEFSVMQMMHPDYEQKKRMDQVRSFSEQLRRFEILRPRVEEDSSHSHQPSCLTRGCVDIARLNRAMTEDGQDGTSSNGGNGSGSGSGCGAGGGSECSSAAVLWSDKEYNRCPVEHREEEGTSQCPFISNDGNTWMEHVANCTWSELQTCVHCEKFEGRGDSVRKHKKTVQGRTRNKESEKGGS